tara:strand:+ start:180 stop:965 length:786 start_codon:yes stop_codon:yes gene_type:complete
MQLKDNQIRFTNVEVLWPRLDKPYAKNAATGQWEKTDVLNKDGKYEITIFLQPEQAEELAGKMSAMFKSDPKTAGKPWFQKKVDPETGAESDVPVKTWEDLFKKLDDGRYSRKLQIPTYGNPNTQPNIYDHHFEEIGIKDREPNFEMTTGSMVNCVVDLRAWEYGKKCGISTRPEAFMVLTRAERKPPPEPAQKLDYFGDLAQPKEKSEGEMIFGDQAVPTTPEPVARATIEAASPFPDAGKKEDIKTHPSLNGVEDEIPF